MLEGEIHDFRWRSTALIRTMALWKSQTKKGHEFQLKSQKERLKKEHEAELHEQEEKHLQLVDRYRQNSNKFSTEYLSALGVELSMDGDLDPETEAEMQKRNYAFVAAYHCFTAYQQIN